MDDKENLNKLKILNNNEENTNNKNEINLPLFPINDIIPKGQYIFTHNFNPIINIQTHQVNKIQISKIKNY